jgi:hypothetical protein
MEKVEIVVRDCLKVHDREITALDYWTLWQQATSEQRELWIQYASELPYVSFAESVCRYGLFEL